MKAWKIAAAGMAAVLCSAIGAIPAKAETSIEVALWGEPPNLDPVMFTNDALATITQHIFETLYTFNSKWEIVPLLASGMPTYSEDGTVVTIPIRTGVPFHDGTTMEVGDVVASLKRWARVSPRAKLVGENVKSIEASGDDKVVVTLNKPFAPLIALIAFNSATAVIMPAELTETDQPITEFIGTGPYKLVERLPDQYTRVVRFDDYQSPPGDPDGYAGSRKAVIDEIRFVPVPSNPTRIAGVISGQYAFADTLPGDSLAQIKAAPNVTPILVKPDWTAFMVINNKGGATANPKIRQAMMAAINPEEMLAAAYGDPELFYVDGSIYGKGALYHNSKATPGFNANDPEKAKELLKEAGYNGEPIRLMTSAQLDVLYKTTLVAKENLERAGFNVDVQVMDWAAVTQKRLNPDEWEGFMAWHSFTPEPSTLTFVNPSYPGWWDNDAKSKLMDAFTSTTDQAERVRLWGELQNLLYEQAATLIVGHFFTLTAINNELVNFQPMPWPFFWNVDLKK